MHVKVVLKTSNETTTKLGSEITVEIGWSGVEWWAGCTGLLWRNWVSVSIARTEMQRRQKGPTCGKLSGDDCCVLYSSDEWPKSHHLTTWTFKSACAFSAAVSLMDYHLGTTLLVIDLPINSPASASSMITFLFQWGLLITTLPHFHPVEC